MVKTKEPEFRFLKATLFLKKQYYTKNSVCNKSFRSKYAQDSCHLRYYKFKNLQNE